MLVSLFIMIRCWIRNLFKFINFAKMRNVKCIIWNDNHLKNTRIARNTIQSMFSDNKVMWTFLSKFEFKNEQDLLKYLFQSRIK